MSEWVSCRVWPGKTGLPLRDGATLSAGSDDRAVAAFEAAGSTSLHYINTGEGDLGVRSADLLYDPGLEFLAVGPPDKHLVALQPDGHRRASNNFSRFVSPGRFRPIFANVADAVHLYNDCSTAARRNGFGENLALCLGPILDVVAGQTTASNVNFFGALPDHFMQIRIICREVPLPRHLFHECSMNAVSALSPL